MEEANIQEAVTMSKIPEPIKFLPSYDGNEKALHHWLATVEGCLAVYEPFANNVFYGFGSQRFVRRSLAKLMKRLSRIISRTIGH